MIQENRTDWGYYRKSGSSAEKLSGQFIDFVLWGVSRDDHHTAQLLIFVVGHWELWRSWQQCTQWKRQQQEVIC